MTRKSKYTLIALAIFAAGIMNLQAQTLKFGHINSADLIQLMPETKNADSAQVKYRKSLEDQMKVMTAEYQNKLKSYQDQGPTMQEAIKATKEKELQDLGDRIQDFQQTAQESIQKKKEELYGPILKKAEDAIKSIAKEKAYSYIFDTSAGSVLFAQPSDDIMAQVKAKLGIK
jgi:outer membrane protein